ncbi:MAG TPA: anti-sigma factor [Vicinamibacterales bacterium]|nr:anti-sigma factor [Vicinamibacterales bacterium]
MYQEASGLDQRLGELQSQLDRLTASLQLWRDQQEHLRPAEDRLADLTRQCADIVNQWSTTGERQARAVGQLEEKVSAFSAAEERLHHDAAERLRNLERVIEQEWSELRQLHEAPARELREQADTLGRISVAATQSSVAGFDRAEARLTAIETSLNQRLNGVSEQVAAAVAEIRALAPMRQADTPALPSWPIEGVVRLHNQLRESNDPASAAAGVATVPAPAPPAGVPAAAPDLFARLETVEQAIAGREGELREVVDEEHRTGRLLRIIAAAAVVLLVLAAAAAGWALQRQARLAAARASDADRQAQALVTAANAQLAAVREESARQIAQAREGADRAQVVSDVLASPDLVRFPIAGSGPAAISGQVLWSRSRGVVFSGVRLPAVAAGMTYQLWLLTDGLPVTAGTFNPEADGRITYTAEAPRVPRPVIGAALTLEPAGGSQTPSELLVQNRVLRLPQ